MEANHGHQSFQQQYIPSTNSLPSAAILGVGVGGGGGVRMLSQPQPHYNTPFAWAERKDMSPLMAGVQLKDVTELADADVLCGRGGAALRHPGNQIYRRLVSLNKGLYTTCLKTEKLKISRGIVAAIRCEKGRFLEKTKDNDGREGSHPNGTWCDIGDKKAIEKTSQALREGQPKLRQQMAQVPGTQSFMAEEMGLATAGIYDWIFAGVKTSRKNT